MSNLETPIYLNFNFFITLWSVHYYIGGGGLYLGGAEARRSYFMLNISSGLIFKPFIHFQVLPVSPAITSSTEDHDSSGLAPAPTVPDTEVSL